MYADDTAHHEALERAVGDARRGPTGLSFPGLLDQTAVWVDRAGRTVRVDDMPLSYLSAVQKFLENRADDLRAQHWRLLIQNPPSGEMAADDIERGLEADDLLSPAEYMSGYPLYRRISELLGDRRFHRDGDIQWPDSGPF